MTNWERKTEKKKDLFCHNQNSIHVPVMGIVLVVILVIKCWISEHQVSVWVSDIISKMVNSPLIVFAIFSFHLLPTGGSCPDPNTKLYQYLVHDTSAVDALPGVDRTVYFVQRLTITLNYLPTWTRRPMFHINRGYWPQVYLDQLLVGITIAVCVGEHRRYDDMGSYVLGQEGMVAPCFMADKHCFVVLRNLLRSLMK
jgi:hypothetical protein